MASFLVHVTGTARSAARSTVPLGTGLSTPTIRILGSRAAFSSCREPSLLWLEPIKNLRTTVPHGTAGKRFGSQRHFTTSPARRKSSGNKDKGDKEKPDTSDKGDSKSSSSSASGGKGDSASGEGAGGQGNGGSGRGDGKSPFEAIQRTLNVLENSLQKPSIPEVYPQVLALPITRRPLFPGFYKAVVIKNPHVTAAIKELMKRGQPYVGAFLLKDEDLDVDTITDINQVHRVGVFAQITSVFPANTGKDEEAGLTAVLYPHRRIRMNELLPLGIQKDHLKVEEVDGEVGAKVNDTSHAQATHAKVEDEGFFEGTESDRAVAEHESQRIKDSISADQQELSSQVHQYATSFLAEDYAVSLANVENLLDEAYTKKNQVIRAVTSEIVSVFKDIASLNPLFRDQIANFSMSQSAGNVFEEPAKLADFAAAVSAGEPQELQEVLESLVIEERLQKALLVLKKELLNAQLQSKISKDVEGKIAKRQREYYLMEQLKGIKKELGLESDGKDKLVEGFKEKAAKLAMPETVKKVFDEEITKLAHLEPAASEFNVTRNYLDWLTQIPWGQRSAENYNIKHAVAVLDEDHHGLQDVKDRILEFIAVGKLRGTVEGKILCLAGPPGVGKTSIGKSIARALDRQFYRFSVGGLTDVAEIKGHRRTYVGAMPGKVVQALKKVQTENPLILIDEVDKVGRGHQGDPSSALLELLDPEQNSSFLDHYMDVPVDLSKVLFVCTANVLDTIPGPLLDRMEVIQLSGYVADEKVAIAAKYLAPTAKTMAGLEKANVILHEDAVESLIKNYCRESGVRNLKKHIDKVYRKAALKIVEKIGDDKLTSQGSDHEKMTKEEKAVNVHEKPGEESVDESKPYVEASTSDVTKAQRHPIEVPDNVRIDITSENLKDYVGPPIFHSERLYEKTPPGVVMGLAWTSMGGSSLYIESVLESALSPKGHPALNKTGQLGDVMKESTTIAYTFAKSLLAKEFPGNRFFEKAQVHLHCPAGAVPKDGPSAGVTMATALLSLALNHPINPDIAMTGELTLTGKVLQIGGLKEKTIAAKRSGVKTILFPRDNQSDWDDLQDHIKEGLRGIPVDNYSDVFKISFENIDREKAKQLWVNELKEQKEIEAQTE
ncbi:Lon protease mitochondrial [Bifiguratus adelaidae]|uniref:Lon protease homolog, mitochondrial n=1 Tax=Bifiguratus adelaidae TaxID=1938954 RepID=A0A261Y1N7_9FUNG|nr:Lon protease mitochondrial [Bifiguratus adelaidae]